MIYDVKVDAARPLLMLREGVVKMPRAIERSINETALEVQREVRGHVFNEFTIRKDFLLKQVKLTPRASASAGRLEARVGIGIGEPVKGSPLLLPKFETGGTRQPVKGKRVAVPTAARPSKSQLIPESLWIQKLQLRRLRAVSRRRRASMNVRKSVRRGLQRTYEIPGLGIAQRVAKGVTRLLYAYVPPFRLQKRLRFYDTARRVVDRVFAPTLRRQVLASFARNLGR